MAAINLPPDIIFAQKATAIVKAAGMDPRTIDLDKFRRDAPIVFSRAYCAIYKEDLLAILYESSSKEDKVLNAQLVIDGLATKTRNPVLQQISGLDIYNGSHKAIGILVGVLFAEGQRLWLEKVKTVAGGPGDGSIDKDSEIDQNMESFSSYAANDHDDETTGRAVGGKKGDRINRDTMKMLEALKNNPNITTAELERLLYGKHGGRSAVEDRLRRRKKKRSKRRFVGKRITDAILHDDDELDSNGDMVDQEKGDQSSSSDDEGETAQSSPRDRRSSRRRTADGVRPSSPPRRAGTAGGGRQVRPSSAPYGRTRRVREVSSRLYDPALNRRTLADYQNENNSNNNNGAPKTPPKKKLATHSGDSPQEGAGGEGEDPSLYTYDWRTGRRILVSDAQQEYEERKRNKAAMGKIMAISDMDGEDGQHAKHHQASSNNYDEPPSPTRAEYPNKSISGDVEKWLARMRRGPYAAVSSGSRSNSGGAGRPNTAGGAGAGGATEEVLPPPRFFAAYQKLEHNDLVISVEHCHNCQHHNMSVRHKPDEYLRHATVALRALAQVAHECGVCARVGVTCIKANITPRSLVTDHDSRIGAFEIQVAFKQPNGKVIPELLHSKLSTRRWPAKSVVEKRLKAFLAAAKVPMHAHEDEHHRPPDQATDSPEPYPVGGCKWTASPLANPLWTFIPKGGAGAGAGQPPSGPQATALASGIAGKLGALTQKPPLAPAPPVALTAAAAASSSSSSGVSNVQWAFDMRGLTDPPPDFLVGSTIRVNHLQYSPGCFERSALLCTVKDYVSHDTPHECDLIVKPKYCKKEVIVPQEDCCNIEFYDNREVSYRVGTIPEELEVLLMYGMKFNLLHWHQASSGDRRDEGTGELFLSRASFFNQVRQLCWEVERRLKKEEGESFDITELSHEETCNTVDIQQSYSEEVIDWAFETFKGEVSTNALSKMVKLRPPEKPETPSNSAPTSAPTSARGSASAAVTAVKSGSAPSSPPASAAPSGSASASAASSPSATSKPVKQVTIVAPTDTAVASPTSAGSAAVTAVATAEQPSEPAATPVTVESVVQNSASATVPPAVVGESPNQASSTAKPAEEPSTKPAVDAISASPVAAGGVADAAATDAVTSLSPADDANDSPRTDAEPTTVDPLAQAQPATEGSQPTEADASPAQAETTDIASTPDVIAPEQATPKDVTNTEQSFIAADASVVNSTDPTAASASDPTPIAASNAASELPVTSSSNNDSTAAAAPQESAVCGDAVAGPVTETKGDAVEGPVTETKSSEDVIHEAAAQTPGIVATQTGAVPVVVADVAVASSVHPALTVSTDRDSPTLIENQSPQLVAGSNAESNAGSNVVVGVAAEQQQQPPSQPDTARGSTGAPSTSRTQLSEQQRRADEDNQTEQEDAERAKLDYQAKDMEVVSIVLEGEQLCHPHYNHIVANLRIGTRSFDAIVCLSKERGSKRRTFNVNWGEFPVAAGSFRNDTAYLSLVVSDSKVAKAHPEIPTLINTTLGKSSNSVAIPLFKLMKTTFDYECTAQVPALIADKSSEISITVHGHAREARNVRVDRISSMTPQALVNVKFDHLLSMDPEEDDDYYSTDSDTESPKKKAGGKSGTPTEKQNLSASVLDLKKSLYPHASASNLLQQAAAAAPSQQPQSEESK